MCKGSLMMTFLMETVIKKKETDFLHKVSELERWVLEVGLPYKPHTTVFGRLALYSNFSTACPVAIMLKWVSFLPSNPSQSGLLWWDNGIREPIRPDNVMTPLRPPGWSTPWWSYDTTKLVLQGASLLLRPPGWCPAMFWGAALCLHVQPHCRAVWQEGDFAAFKIWMAIPFVCFKSRSTLETRKMFRVWAWQRELWFSKGYTLKVLSVSKELLHLNLSVLLLTSTAPFWNCLLFVWSSFETEKHTFAHQTLLVFSL